MKKNVKISDNTIRRLPKYLRKLSDLQSDGVQRISSFELGNSLGNTPSQIRQDFSHFGNFGQQGYGYHVENLQESIREILGLDQQMSAILLGVGNIGQALMKNFDFTLCGVQLQAAFDIDPGKIGNTVNGLVVRDQAELAAYLKNAKPDLAILCVPSDVAVELAGKLIALGIEAIWNFTNTEITAGDSEVLVENLHFTDSLLTLRYYIAKRNEDRVKKEEKYLRSTGSRPKRPQLF